MLLLLLVMMMIFILFFFEEERTERDIFSRFRFARRGPIGCCAPDRLPRVPQGFPLFKYRSSAENKTSETRIPLPGLPCFMNISSQWSECLLICFDYQNMHRFAWNFYWNYRTTWPIFGKYLDFIARLEAELWFFIVILMTKLSD